MNALAAGGFAVAGALTGIPIAAVAHAVPAHGAIRVPRQWWRGAPARPAVVLAMSILTGAVAGLVASCLPLSPALPAFWLFAVLGVGLAIIDLRHHRLPHVMTGALWLACSVGTAAESLASGHVRPFAMAAAAGAAVTVLALVIALALPGQLGLGDVSLSGVIALSLGSLSLHAAVVGLVSGVTLQATLALAKVMRDRERLRHVAFGPALLLGWLVAVCSQAV